MAEDQAKVEKETARKAACPVCELSEDHVRQIVGEEAAAREAPSAWGRQMRREAEIVKAARAVAREEWVNLTVALEERRAALADAAAARDKALAEVERQHAERVRKLDDADPVSRYLCETRESALSSFAGAPTSLWSDMMPMNLSDALRKNDPR